MTAFSLLDDQITDAKSWEIYAMIEMGHLEAALLEIQALASNRAAADAQDVLANIWRRSGGAR